MFTKDTRNEMFDTVIANGGSTLSLSGEMLKLKSGYASSLSGLGDVIPVKGLTPVNLENVVVALVNKVDGLADPKNHFIGLWVNGDELHVDLTVIHTSMDAALNAARNNNQAAIYEFATGQSITL